MASTPNFIIIYINKNRYLLNEKTELPNAVFVSKKVLSSPIFPTNFIISAFDISISLCYTYLDSFRFYSSHNTAYSGMQFQCFQANTA